MPLDVLPGALSASVLLLVENVGGDSAGEISIVLKWLDQESKILLVSQLSPGAADTVSIPLPRLSGQRVMFHVSAVLAGDHNRSNDSLEWSVSFGVAALSVVINEIMPSPDEGPEWIEILNRTAQPISLDGWTVTDASGREGKIPDEVLPAEGFRVLPPDKQLLPAEWVAVGNWPTLNNGSDRIVLKDVSGAVIDEMLYDGSPRSGRSLERIDSASGSMDIENWIPNALNRGGTPARSNGAALAAADLGIRALPDPFDKQTTLSATLPIPRSSAILQVYDRRGRLCRRLLDGVEVGSSFSVLWDGRDDDGQWVRPGAYVVYLEVSDSEGGVLRE